MIQLEQYTMAVVSLSHLTLADLDYLLSADYPFEVLVASPGGVLINPVTAVVDDSRISKDSMKLFKFLSSKVDYVKFDPDGPVVPGFSVFEGNTKIGGPA